MFSALILAQSPEATVLAIRFAASASDSFWGGGPTGFAWCVAVVDVEPVDADPVEPESVPVEDEDPAPPPQPTRAAVAAIASVTVDLEVHAGRVRVAVAFGALRTGATRYTPASGDS